MSAVGLPAYARHELTLRVWGDNACFTRPEFKVERVSYDVMTPSAARGILEAIYWKPAMAWRILRIDVLRPIRWEAVRRNEVDDVVPIDNVTEVMKRGRGRLGLFAEESRQQRASQILRDVEYRIHAGFVLTDRAGTEDTLVKLTAMFQRRARAGQCFSQPYLGCREFPAYFELHEGEGGAPPIAEDRELGWMLYDIEHGRNGPSPCFFKAELQGGVLHVPSPESDQVKR
ncbi:MAG: type I-C CRISPR-associated protein Cas5 [Candidatus Wallbacteria bacterium]|nr:type I-C CRISPR-associated protein Cas5 [Candidatus Wallbacteria bacterium]